MPVGIRSFLQVWVKFSNNKVLSKSKDGRSVLKNLGETNCLAERFDDLTEAAEDAIDAMTSRKEAEDLWEGIVVGLREIYVAGFEQWRLQCGVEKAKYNLETEIGNLKLMDAPEWGGRRLKEPSSF